jgi:hypothetical protein
MKRFWQGFEKKALLTGGGGHSGVGKGVLIGGLEWPMIQGTEGSLGSAEGEDSRASHELYDRERTSKNDDITELEGPEFVADSNPHLRY